MHASLWAVQIPRKCRVVTVVGPPLPLPKIDNPSDAVVREYLEKYIALLQALFDKYKGQYSPESAPLVVL